MTKKKVPTATPEVHAAVLAAPDKDALSAIEEAKTPRELSLVAQRLTPSERQAARQALDDAYNRIVKA